MSDHPIVQVVITRNPFFSPNPQVWQSAELFYGLQLKVTGPFPYKSEEKCYMVTLSEIWAKLQNPDYERAKLLFGTMYPFAPALDVSPIEGATDDIMFPLRVSGCEMIHGAIQ